MLTVYYLGYNEHFCLVKNGFHVCTGLNPFLLRLGLFMQYTYCLIVFVICTISWIKLAEEMFCCLNKDLLQKI